MKRLLISFVFFVSMFKIFGQNYSFPIFNIDSIINITYKDTLDTNFGLKKYCIEYCEKLKNNGNKRVRIFPYFNFDKVLLCTVNNDKDLRLFFNSKGYFSKIDNKYIKNGIVLNNGQITRLLYLINYPLNFEYSECGSPTPEYEFVFFNKNSKIIERLVIACDMTQLITSDMEKSYRMKFGDFFRGKFELEKLINEIKTNNSN